MRRVLYCVNFNFCWLCFLTKITSASLILLLPPMFIWQAGLFDEVLVNDDFQLTVNTLFRLMRDWWVWEFMSGFGFDFFLSVMFDPHHCYCWVILFAELCCLLKGADTELRVPHSLFTSHFFLFFFFALRYPALPSAARIRMLQRRLKSIKSLTSPDRKQEDEVKEGSIFSLPDSNCDVK